MLTCEDFIIITLMKNDIRYEYVPPGVYSIEEYKATGKIDYGNDEGLKYHHYPKYGNGFVTYVNSENKRKVIWCADLAKTDHASEINTVGIIEHLSAGECFEVITNINNNISDKVHWQTKQWLMVPPNCVGMVQHPDVNSDDPEYRVGYIIIVPTCY